MPTAQTTNTARRTEEQFSKSPNLISQETMDDFSQSVNDLKTRVQDLSTNLAERSVTVAKKYPVHTALTAAAVGLVVGFLLRRPGK